MIISSLRLSINTLFKLTDRERLILRSIVHNYILTAEPVGSRILTRRYRIGLSPATIRNTMSDLEEMGLLTHPHTSAGRVPTDLGYRIYVDDLMHVEDISDDVRQTLQAKFDDISPEINDVLDNVGELLSEVSHLLAVIIAPDLSTGVLDKIEFVRVASGRIMIVVVIRSGLVRTILLEMNSNITDTEIANATQVINQRLSGLCLSDIHQDIDRRLSGEHCSRNSIVRLFLDFPEKIFGIEPGKEMHIGSARPLLEQPEYSSPDQFKGIIELIEDRDIIVHLLKDRSQGVSVTIGEENKRERLKDFSVITSTYRIGDELGTLGIIGPTRMNYSRLVALVDYTARMVSRQATYKDVDTVGL
ncbi:MAG: heat-inducible transcriptional repressor HrcA [Candidatus Hatepunaea meridiana]|nr:heat-inducible transcriptional repressor HrcA [Candidatus Hatepunaea meridiana]